MLIRPALIRPALAALLTVSIGTAVGVVSSGEPSPPSPGASALIDGPYRVLLGESTDLGASHREQVQLTAALRSADRPGRLIAWAADRGLSVRWRAGDAWAIVAGPTAALASALRVDIRDYRHRRGEIFYASPQQPAVPVPLAGELSGLGRILSYTPRREAGRWELPLEVPDQGLRPDALQRAYNVAPLREAGYTGRGVTVIVFAFDGFDQADLDMFSATFDLPAFTPDVVGGQPPARRGEATMDLQAVHAVAPEAKKVLVNANPTVQGEGAYEKIAAMMEDADARYPGAVWSFSIGWGCDKLITAADLVPVRAALAKAQANGTTAFDASGDLAGLECKGGEDWSAPPSPDNIGLDAVASMPEMTSVGGTTLSTDADGGWLAEQAWFDSPLSQGSAGGVSALFDRPDWQGGLRVAEGGSDRRLTPDIAAVADPFTGVQIVFDKQLLIGGGTSLAAPLWAGMTAVMNQYLIENGGDLIGDLNPLLYTIAKGSRLPAFRDIVLGGNAVANAAPGYDLVTGLGTPNVDNLVRDILVAQKRLP